MNQTTLTAIAFVFVLTSSAGMSPVALTNLLCESCAIDQE
jgi:hypothetical protein